MQKLGNPATETQILDLMKKEGRPVTTGYIAYNIGVCWSTARGVLLDMALKNKLKAVKTTQSFVFIRRRSSCPALHHMKLTLDLWRVRLFHLRLL
jgi:hypothetical protein